MQVSVNEHKGQGQITAAGAIAYLHFTDQFERWGDCFHLFCKDTSQVYVIALVLLLPLMVVVCAKKMFVINQNRHAF